MDLQLREHELVRHRQITSRDATGAELLVPVDLGGREGGGGQDEGRGGGREAHCEGAEEDKRDEDAGQGYGAGE